MMFEKKQFIVNLPLPDEEFGLHITLMFYGELAEHIGMNQMDLPFIRSLSITELKEQLSQIFYNWQVFPDTIQQAINRELVEDTAVVNVCDEVAFFPSLFEPNFKLA